MGKKTKTISTKPALRHGRAKAFSKSKSLLKFILSSLLVCAISATAIAAYTLFDIKSNIKTVDIIAPKNISEHEAKSLDGAINMLLIGTDSRAGTNLDDGYEGELNDVNMLLMVSSDHKYATVVSIPRDLMIAMPECTNPENGETSYATSLAQVNTALSRGGLSCAVLTIAEETEVPIAHAAMIKFNGVTAMSNAVGGVEVTLDEPLNDPYTGIKLPAGTSKLVGNDALLFLRSRYGTEDGSDLSRIKNQQMFMKNLVTKLKSSGTLNNPQKVIELAKTATKNITFSNTSINSLSNLVALSNTLKDIPDQNITFVQYPAGASESMPGKLIPNEEKASAMFKHLLANGRVTKTGAIVPGTGKAPAATIDSSSGLLIDKESGFYIEPRNGLPIDTSVSSIYDEEKNIYINPSSGLPFDIDTGRPVDPTTGKVLGNSL